MNTKTLSLYDAFVCGFKTTLDRIPLFFKATLLFFFSMIIGLIIFAIIAMQIGQGTSNLSLDSGQSYMLQGVWKIFFGKIFSQFGFTKSIALGSFFIGYVLCFKAWIITGLLRLTLDVYNNGTALLSSAYMCGRYIPSMVLLLVLLFCIVAGGLLCFIIPGIYLLVRFSLSCCILVDTRCSAVEALRRSFSLTKNYFWELLALYSISVTFVMSMSIFFVWPILLITWIHIYKQLLMIQQNNFVH